MRILLLVWLAASLPSYWGQQPKPPDSKEKRTKQAKTQTVVPVPDNQKKPAKQENSTPANVENEVPWWKDAGEATWALVIVGICGTLAAIWTLVTIRKQTNALMDADHVLILTFWEGYIHMNPDKPGVLSHCFNWHFHNAGKSPTFIRQVSSRFIVIKDLNELPKKPIYPRPKTTLTLEPVLPEKRVAVYTPIESTLTYEQLEDELRQANCSVYAYGYVQYLDIYRRKHETRFGVLYDFKGRHSDPWKLAGPRAYNRYT